MIICKAVYNQKNKQLSIKLWKALTFRGWVEKDLGTVTERALEGVGGVPGYTGPQKRRVSKKKAGQGCELPFTQ